MAETIVCLGHGQRVSRGNKIKKHLDSQLETPVDESLRVVIKKGPTSIETSLKELEETFASKLEWKVIENGGVLSSGWSTLPNLIVPEMSKSQTRKEKEQSTRLRVILLPKRLPT